MPRAEPPGRPGYGPSDSLQPAGDRPSDLIGTVLLHEVQTSDDDAVLASVWIRPVMNTPGSVSIKSFGSRAVLSHPE